MTVHVPAIAPGEISTSATGAQSADVRARVEAARQLQRERYRTIPGVFCNAHVSGRWLETHTRIEPAARAALVEAAERLLFSARAYHRVLRVARTVADVEGAQAIGPDHIAASVSYRSLGARKSCA